MRYVPSTIVLTDPDEAIAMVPTPSKSSDQVAHCSAYASPCVSVMVPDPTSDTTGGVVSGTVVMVTLRVTVLLILPAASV